VRLRGEIVLVVALLGLLGAGAARGQLQGQIATAKQAYVAGEPVYVHFEVTNVGKEPVVYDAGDPYSDGCGYSLEVASGPPLKHPSCAPVKAEACDTSEQILGAGETVRQNLLVNYAHDVGKSGDYEIHAVRVMRYGPMGTAAAEWKEFKLEKSLQIQVARADRDALQGIYRVYVRNLGSQDDEIQREAERAIVSGAMPWLEDTIVGMVRQYRSREFALLGLRNLNTPRAREELAKIAQSTSQFTLENEAAVGYLGQMGDKKYFPMLLELAKKAEPGQGREYVLAAAELGGDEAVAYLKELAGSADGNARASGVMGLGMTGSRAAVPVLIAMLKGTDGGVAESALVELTHRGSGWADGAGKVYGPRECGEVEGLP
jgi:hypothetical protein